MCSQHAAVRDVMGELPRERPDDVTILDMEASIEHLSRGTARNVDGLLVVTEPYYRSLETIGRLVPAARELGLRVWVVANKVRATRDEAAIREYCGRRAFEIISVVPFDEGVTEADHMDRALVDHSPAGPAVSKISELASELVDRLGKAAPAEA